LFETELQSYTEQTDGILCEMLHEFQILTMVLLCNFLLQTYINIGTLNYLTFTRNECPENNYELKF
jgi:hypothetical protein